MDRDRSAEARAWWRRAAVVGASVAVVWLYFWIARPAVSQLGNAQAKTAYYNLLIDGFRDGQLSMKVDPKPELATLGNPYDPVQNGPYRLHDATYYHGKYFLYFGVTPALVLFLPYAVLTGDYLWHRQAVALFGAAGFLVSVGVLCAVRRRYFPRAGAGPMFFAVVGMGLANTLPILMRRPDVWEVPIACAAMFVLLALAAIWRALHEVKHRTGWVLAASLAYGLAVGARPPVLFGAVILLAPAAFARLRENGAGRTFWQLVAAAIAPLTFIGLALLFYNWLRFDDALEFGQKYQLAGVDNTRVKFFSPEFFWYHLRLYLWEPSHWSLYFPFVAGIHVPPSPPGQLGVENVFGVLTNDPFVWWGFAALFGVAVRTAWRWWAFSAALYAAVCGGTVCLFGGACNRYFVDFLPPWILLSAAGILALEHGLGGSGWRWPVRVLWGATVLVSGGFVFFSSCQHLGFLRLRDPRAYTRLATFFDAPIAWVESRLGVHFGPLEITLELPPFTTQRMEALLVTGAAPEADYFWVEYLDPRHIRLGLEHTFHGGPASEPLAVDYQRAHTITVKLRSLYPPAEHSYWGTREGARTAAGRDEFLVLLDDRFVLRGTVAGYDASRLTRFIGANPYDHQTVKDFSGSLLSQRTLGPALPAVVRRPGPVEVRLWLPHGVPPGLTEPLLQTGEAGKADTLWIRYVDNHHIVLGLDHWRYGGPQTVPIAIDDNLVQNLEIQMGSLYPPGSDPGPTDPRRSHLEIRLNGVVVLQGTQDFYPAPAIEVYVGRNPLGASSATERFTGRMVEPQPPGVTR